MRSLLWVVGGWASSAAAAPVAHWRFDGNASDSVGTRHGNVIGGTTTYVTGVAGQAIQLQSDGAKVQFSSVLSTLGSGPFTVSIWARHDALFAGNTVSDTLFHDNANGVVLSGNKNSAAAFPPDGLGLTARINGAAFSAEPSAVDRTSDVNPWLESGGWHHVVMGRTATTEYLYVDGALVSSGARAAVSHTNPYVTSVGYHAGNNHSWPGAIDDLQVYDDWVGPMGVALLYASPGTRVDGSSDLDSDGHPDVADTCPGRADAAQLDSDGDGYGDACASPRASIGSNVVHFGDAVAANAVVGAGAVLGRRSAVGRRAEVGAGASLGEDVVLAADTFVAAGATLGARTTLAFGAVAFTDVGTDVLLGNLSTVGATASVGAGVTIGRSGVVDGSVGDDVSVGAGAQVDSGATIGTGTRVGGNTIVHAAVVGDHVVTGRGVVIGAGATIGANSRLRAGAIITPGATVPPNTVVPPGTWP